MARAELDAHGRILNLKDAPQAVFKVARVGGRYAIGIAHEKHERRRLLLSLGQIEELGADALDERRLMGVKGFLHGPVELCRGHMHESP